MALFFLLLIVGACNGKISQPFEPKKWSMEIDGDNINREQIVTDLMQNNLKVGMKYFEVVALWGKPENHSDIYPYS